MPRKRHVYRPPWAEALKYFSSEAELERVARTKETRRDWRKLGVPADVLLPISIRLTDQLLARGLPLVEGRAQHLPEWVAEMQEIAKSPPIVLEVFRDLRAIQSRDADLFVQIRNWIHAQRARLEPPAAKKKRKSG